ncbi:soluble guanylate cyclase 88E-like [Ptychodera flava]|uniref:soluble guanylate cyclase 88E-like n=1 Tax=Ptychodera flava TaxID=63121 RepID=UPI00396AA138
MYGLLIAGVCNYLKKRFGEDTLALILEKSGLNNASFSAHAVYDENIIAKLSAAAVDITKVDSRELLEGYGVYFVGYTGDYGYDRILRVLGRHMRDFLNGLDNLHEYLRFSYPAIQPPSFFATEETRHGLTLHYRSRRTGFVRYIVGQLKEVGRRFYNLDIKAEVISEVTKDDKTFHAVFRLHFDNRAYKYEFGSTLTTRENWNLRSDDFFEIFPFSLVFDGEMTIRYQGPKIAVILPSIIGKKLTKVFTLTRPIISFTWDNIIINTNNIFEIASVDRVTAEAVQARIVDTATSDDNAKSNDGAMKGNLPNKHPRQTKKAVVNNANGSEVSKDKADDSESDDGSGDGRTKPRRLYLKGQMKYMAKWNCMVYLCSPLIPNLEALFRTGLFINDLSLHDSSRDLALVGTQQSAELKMALDQEQRKSAKLEESMKKLDEEMKKTDSLLYQMIPRQVADRLRRGEPAMNTCEVFQDVSILFSDVVGFTKICSMITPMQVVSMLNSMYSMFDKLVEKNRVYKVETIGDAYMVVSGAPTKTKYHAENITDMAFDMVECMRGQKDPASGDSMKIRIGIHSGMVVAGVVGIKMPRYCLFGDTVNTASRMESNGEAMKIHISQVTKDYLAGGPYEITERGMLQVKGKGEMKTYWLEQKTGVLAVSKDGMAVPNVSRSPSVIGANDELLVAGGSAADVRVRRRSHDSDEYRVDIPLSAVHSPAHFPGGKKVERHGATVEELELMVQVLAERTRELENEVERARKRFGRTDDGGTGTVSSGSDVGGFGPTYSDLDYYQVPSKTGTSAAAGTGHVTNKNLPTEQQIEHNSITINHNNTTNGGEHANSPAKAGNTQSMDQIKIDGDAKQDVDRSANTTSVPTSATKGNTSKSQSVTCVVI